MGAWPSLNFVSPGFSDLGSDLWLNGDAMNSRFIVVNIETRGKLKGLDNSLEVLYPCRILASKYGSVICRKKMVNLNQATL